MGAVQNALNEEFEKIQPLYGPQDLKKMDKVKFKDILPDRGFLKDFYDTFRPTSCTPDVFLLMGGLVALSTVLGNKVRMPFSNGFIYPNLWVAIIAPSALYRKSTAIGFAEYFVRTFNNDLLLPNIFTMESLLAILSDEQRKVGATGLLSWKEFASALKSFEKQFMIGTKETLQDLFDCPPYFKKKIQSAEYELRDPTFTIFAAGPASLIKSSSTTTDFTGGFYNRFLWVSATSNDLKNSIPIPPQPTVEQLEKLWSYMPYLKGLEMEGTDNFGNKLKREFEIITLKDTYGKWARTFERSIIGHSSEETLAGFYTRLEIYCLKFAMIYHVALKNDVTTLDYEISEEALTYAINLTNFLRSKLHKTILEEISVTQAGSAEDKERRVLNVLAKNGGTAKKRDIQHYGNFKYAEELNATLEVMVDEGKIKQDKNRSNIYSSIC